MDTYFSKHAEGYVNVNTNAMDPLYIEGSGSTITVLTDDGISTINIPERRTRSGAATLAAMGMSESGGRILALTSRRACA